MIGRVKYETGKGRIHWEKEILHGIAVCSVTYCEPRAVHPALAEQRIRKMEKLLRKAGAARVMLPERFPYRHLLSQVQVIDTLNLYRCAADLLVLEDLSRRNIDCSCARVSLMGHRLYPELCETAKRLCRSVRKLRIDVPGEDGDRFGRMLQREYGLPVLPQSAAVDIAVSFGPATDAADLALWGEDPKLKGMRLEAEGLELPEEIKQPMLALLWEQGRLRREGIRVVNVL